MRDNLKVKMLSIGHGDALLLTAMIDNQLWNCLIDGGSSQKALLAGLADAGVTTLDLLILSHFDHDHIGGLIGITNSVKVLTYWGPALPAFDRHYWLFGSRIQKALDKAKALEEELLRSQAEILYPLEGFRSAPFERGGPTLHVLSPPARLIRELVTGENIRSFYSGDEMPLGWLLAPPPEEIDKNHDVSLFDGAAQRGFLVSSDISDRMRQRLPAPAPSEASPEFFGDALVNNTSLVIWIEMRTGKKSHSLLLTGDLENWTYLLACYPRGLHADVLKASHHGGKVKLENDLAHDEMLSQVRPRVVLVSGCGTHELPHSEFRNSAIRWGSSVFCTSQRRLENVSRVADEQKCCFNEHNCERRTGAVELELDEKGIRANTTACHSGYGDGPGSVIQLRQHILEPSPIVSRLFEQELSKHLNWMQSELELLHNERCRLRRPDLTGTAAIATETLLNRADSSRRARLAPHLQTLLSEGRKRRSFWASEGRSNSHTLYALPKKTDISTFHDFLDTKDLLIFEQGCKEAASLDRSSVLNRLKTEGLALHANIVTTYPHCLFRDAIWPNLTGIFEKERHGFLFRESGTIAISKASTIEELVEILRTFLRAKEDDTIDSFEHEYDWESSTLLAYINDNSEPALTERYKIVDVMCEGSHRNSHSNREYCPNFRSRVTQLW